MAPKLPPPANTKAVFAGTAWFDTDKVLFAPAIVALANRHATFGCGYSSGRAGCTINIGCCGRGVRRAADAARREKLIPIVIPGCATWRRPGIHTPDRGMDSGLARCAR